MADHAGRGRNQTHTKDARRPNRRSRFRIGKLNIRDRPDRARTGERLTKRGVRPIQSSGALSRQTQEKLAARTVWIVVPSHRNHSEIMGKGAALHGEPRSRPAISGGRRIASLNHKGISGSGVRHDAVKNHVTVVAVPSQGREMFRGVGRSIPSHLHLDLAVVGPDHHQLVWNQPQARSQWKQLSNRSGLFELSFILGLHSIHQLIPRPLHRRLGVWRWPVGKHRWLDRDVKFIPPTHHPRVRTSLRGGCRLHDGHLAGQQRNRDQW